MKKKLAGFILAVIASFTITTGSASALGIGDPVPPVGGGDTGGSSPVFNVAAAINARLDAFEASYYPRVPDHVRVAAQSVIAELRARYS